MILKNKKTGEVVDSKELLTDGFIIDIFSRDFDYFNSKLRKLQDEWEEYKEPKEYWYIGHNGEVYRFSAYYLGTEVEDAHREIGNLFDTQEEAEKAVERLRAWKQLKDKGFRFTGVYDDYTIEFTAPKEEIGWFWCNGMDKDLDLLFGGKDGN